MWSKQLQSSLEWVVVVESVSATVAAGILGRREIETQNLPERQSRVMVEASTTAQRILASQELPARI
jgi:hypothetical protein